MNTYRFHEFDIPVDLLNLTGGGVDTFDKVSAAHVENLKKHIGISPEHFILEIGCAIGRDAIPLTKMLSDKGRYLGIDIIKPSIDFCLNNISRKYKNFDFVFFDVSDQLHNPLGTSRTLDIVLPLEDSSVDRIILWSVFTHMYEVDIRHYLKEFRRVLKPDGLVYATIFVVDDSILECARRTNLTKYNLRFEHKLSDDVFINDPVHPLGAIAYSKNALCKMVDDSGLELQRDFLRGAWSGYYPDPEDGQDVMVLRVKSISLDSN